MKISNEIIALYIDRFTESRALMSEINTILNALPTKRDAVQKFPLLFQMRQLLIEGIEEGDK